MQIKKSLDLNNPPPKFVLMGGVGSYAFGEGAKVLLISRSRSISPSPGGRVEGEAFGAGVEDLNTNSNLNFSKNNISPSQNLQANSTLPRGEGNSIECFASSTPRGEGDEDRENNISPSQICFANLPSLKGRVMATRAYFI